MGDELVNITMAEALINDTVDVYEKYLIATCFWSPKFFMENRKYLIEEEQRITSYQCSDFTTQIDNDIMDMLVRYYHLFDEVDPATIPLPTSDWVISTVESGMATGDKSTIDLRNTTNRINYITSNNPEPLLYIVQAGLAFWVQKKRSRQLMAKELHSNSNISDIIEKFRALETTTAPTNKGVKKFSAGFLEESTVAADSIVGPIKVMNHAMDGGLAKGDAMVIVVPQGGGKTVLAVQYCVELAMKGRKTLLITTEQGVDELLPRAVACHRTIDFGLLKSGINKNTDVDKALLRDTMDMLDEHVRIWEWNDGSYNLATDIPASMDTMIAEEGFDPDLMVVDWIGGGMAAATGNDMTHYRLLYQGQADAQVKLAKRYDMGVIAFAQAALGKAENKQRIDHGMIAECKTLARDYTWGIGISAQYEKSGDKDDPTVSQTFKDKQFMNFFKGRKSVGGLVAVERQFKHQRFKDTIENEFKSTVG